MSLLRSSTQIVLVLSVLYGCHAKPWYLQRAEAEPDFRLAYELCRDEAYDAASRRPVIISKVIESCLRARGYEKHEADSGRSVP